MSKFWFWFIPFILIICLIIFVLITKVDNKTIILDDFKLEFNNKVDNIKKVATLGDKKIYSSYAINKINGNNLSAYLNDELMNKIIDKMDYVDSLNDGGTTIYYSNTLANEEFYIIKCQTLLGNNDIYISSSMDIGYCRS